MKKNTRVKKVGNVGGVGKTSPCPTNPTNSVNHGSPVVLDAIIDSQGRRYVKVGASDFGLWFPVSDLVNRPREVFGQLSERGWCISPKSQEALKTLVENHATFRNGLVSDRTGWIDNHFVRGDGTVISPPNSRKVIVCFQGKSKFTAVGSLKQWQNGLALVQDQKICLFGLALGFSGPVVPLMPSGFTNPFVEIVGRAQCGKSTLGTMISSVFAGDPNASCGGGESWSTTLNALFEKAMGHRHQTLLLDEANLIDNTSGQIGEFLKNAVFKLAEGHDKSRFGHGGSNEHFQLAFGSTSNVPLRGLVKGDPEVLRAVTSRVITVEIANEFGILDFVPDGYETAREAIEGLRAAIDRNYGVAGSEFVKQLVNYRETKSDQLSRFISGALKRYRSQSSEFGSDPRIQNQFAVIAIAGHMAQKFKILPEAWGSVFEAVLTVHAYVASWEQSHRPLSASEKVLRYVDESEDERLSLPKCKSLNALDAFKRSAGCVFMQGERGSLSFRLVNSTLFSWTIVKYCKLFETKIV